MEQRWIDKYRPISLDKVICEARVLARLDEYMAQYSRRRQTAVLFPNLMITGSNGTGKTLIVDLLLKKYGYSKLVCDLSTIITPRKGSGRGNITSNKLNPAISFYNTIITDHYDDTVRHVLVIEDISNITNRNERDTIKAIIKINNECKKIPIILTANMKHVKFVNEVKKLLTYQVRKNINNAIRTQKIISEITLKIPDYYRLESFINEICRVEGINLHKSSGTDIYDDIITHSQYDMRRLVNILEDIKIIYGKNVITTSGFSTYVKTSIKKDIDPGIFDATKNILNNKISIADALILYSEDRATIPLMIYENYPTNIHNQYTRLSVTDKIDMMFHISKSISISDKVDGDIYSNQCWYLQPVHGYYSCIVPSYHINSRPGKMRKIESYNYTRDYNRTSIQKINLKGMKNVKNTKMLTNVSLMDFLYISKILRHMIDLQEYEKMVTLVEPYNLQLKDIESIIKIDKIILDRTKKNKNITTKQKKQISTIICNNEHK
jgi:hypothetical protein